MDIDHPLLFFKCFSFFKNTPCPLAPRFHRLEFITSSDIGAMSLVSNRRNAIICNSIAMPSWISCPELQSHTREWGGYLPRLCFTCSMKYNNVCASLDPSRSLWSSFPSSLSAAQSNPHQPPEGFHQASAVPLMFRISSIVAEVHGNQHIGSLLDAFRVISIIESQMAHLTLAVQDASCSKSWVV